MGQLYFICLDLAGLQAKYPAGYVKAPVRRPALSSSGGPVKYQITDLPGIMTSKG